MPKTINYTAELTQKIIDDYQNGSSVQAIAESIGKSLQSVRSKLVREGVYIAQEKKSKSNKPCDCFTWCNQRFNHWLDWVH